MKLNQTDVVILGAGIIGIATAYYLKKHSPLTKVTLVEQDQPMAFTSAQSGENYRNWWPHKTMKAFTEHSIKLMENIAVESDDLINMTRRGYILATRSNDVSNIVHELEDSYGTDGNHLIRHHTRYGSNTYQAPISERWQDAPQGVDILKNTKLIQACYPNFDADIKSIIHIRQAGMLDSQQMATFMLTQFKALGGERVLGKVIGIDKGNNFTVNLSDNGKIIAKKAVNACGPFAKDIAQMLDVSLPVENILQQKIAFPDVHHAIPRVQPFSIDLDAQYIDWEEDERTLLAAEDEYKWLTEEFTGSIHCRPEGGDNGNWVKLGWAFNELPVDAQIQPLLNDNYPEIVLRGAARLNPALKSYYGKLPRNMVHYGGYYTATKENWPLIGETSVKGFYINGAMSGFGTMAACAAGELCAQWILNVDLPDYAYDLSLERYNNSSLIEELKSYDKGIL
jgi:glycine/D-amino acid oxidase-like deaminating enzyme